MCLSGRLGNGYWTAIGPLRSPSQHLINTALPGGLAGLEV
jgi:hypothetical protein